MKRWWLSWYECGPDVRPINYPPGVPILGWWHTGSDDHYEILCALVEAPTEALAWAHVDVDWPDKVDRRFSGECEPDHVITSDRFPLSDWMIPRMKASR